MGMITLKPGYLVGLHTKLEGGVQYTRTDLSADSTEGDGAAIERWETVKVTEDPEEHARAVKVRGKAGSLVRSVCSLSAFGLLCAANRERQLDEAVEEAHALVNTFNESATSTRLSVYVLKGRIAESDGEAARAIAGELREILGTMKDGIEQADVETIRAAANKAKKLGGMLDAGAAEKVSAAIEEARSVAREIVKRATKRGEDVGAYVKEVNLKAIEEARFSFLDMDGPAEVTGEALPVVEARALDMDDSEVTTKEEVEAASDTRTLDMDDEDDTRMAASPSYKGPKYEV
jgi:hypothetical protein